MQKFLLSLSLVASAAVGVVAENSPDFKIDVTQEVECERKTVKGDTVQVHYHGSLASNGNKFDASYDRGTPLNFALGTGRVIKGWDEGLLDMCIGEKRTLTVPPEMGYGKRSMGPIPADSTLIFKTELMGIQGVPNPDPIVYKSAETAEPTESSGSVAGKVEEVVEEVVAEAADAAKTMLVDTDDIQEHNEL